jgi:hypothetical protein
MNLKIILTALAALAVIWSVVSSIRIYEALRRMNVNVNFLWLRVMIPKYAQQYKEITIKETGKPGPLYYHWIISINLVLVMAVALILVLLLG